MSGRERMSIVVAGHVDHGKSTVVGRLLADTGSLPEGKLEQVRATCARTGKPFEYAFLLDALRDERAQGITIDSARVFFTSAQREYLIIDAPGHIEFLKNMISGAARAEAAFLVVDAAEGVQDNSRRHGYLLALLGIRQVVILVNKMDLVGYDQGVFDRLVAEYRAFLEQVGMRPAAFIPVAGRDGANIVHRDGALAWYDGPTALEALDAFETERLPADRALRLPVQDVYKFTGNGDTRRIVAGTVEAGTLRPGDDIVFHPSGKRARVRTIESFHGQTASAAPGIATGFTVDEQIYVTRGEIVTRAADPQPAVATRLAVSIFWLAHRPLVADRDYLLKLGTARVRTRLESIERVIDASDLRISDAKRQVERHDVADCVLRLARPIACDPVDRSTPTGRFVLVDEYEISGGGIVRAALPDLPVRRAAAAGVSAAGRAARFGQRPTLLLALSSSDATEAMGETLAGRLVDEGRLAHHLHVGRNLALPRAAGAMAALLDIGAVVVVTAESVLTEAAAELVDELPADQVLRAWIGSGRPGKLPSDFDLPDLTAADAADTLWRALRERRRIPGT